MSKLKQVIEEIVGDGTILTIQPGGNYGDYLIYRGFNKMAEKAKIKKTPLTDDAERYDAPPSIPSSDIIAYSKWVDAQLNYIRNRFTHDISAVYIHGGGNFNDLWTVGVDCYKTVARYFSCPIIIGPQSCIFQDSDPKKIFKNTNNNTHFFCREKYSYDIINSATKDQSSVSVHLSQDTALYLDSSDIYSGEYSEDYSLIAMRTGKESSEPLINHNIEKPLLVRDISVTANSFDDWIDTVANAKVVFTDRLHVAILATILDKRVYWYETSYHKSRGVYEYSLSENDKLKFHYL